MRFAAGLAVAVAVLGMAACGGGGSGTASCTPGPTAAVAITATGLNPTNVCVSPSGQVTFTNSDTAATHDIEFDLTACGTGGNIAPGAALTVTLPATVATCSFHDGKNAGVAAFAGTVAVTDIVVSGGGY
jgi:hypothetical protein